jgi:hypothetical protein
VNTINEKVQESGQYLGTAQILEVIPDFFRSYKLDTRNAEGKGRKRLIEMLR